MGNGLPSRNFHESCDYHENERNKGFGELVNEIGLADNRETYWRRVEKLGWNNITV